MSPRKESTRSRGGVKSGSGRSRGKTTIKNNNDIDQKNGIASTESGKSSRRSKGKSAIITEFKGVMTRSRAKKLEQEKEKKEKEQEQEEQQEQEQYKRKFRNQPAKKIGAKNSAAINTATKRKDIDIFEQGAAKEVTGKIPANKKKTHHETNGTEVKDKVNVVDVDDGEMEVDDFLEIVERGCGSSRGRRRTCQNTTRFVPPFPFPQPETEPYDYYFCAWRVKNKK